MLHRDCLVPHLKKFLRVTKSYLLFAYKNKAENVYMASVMAIQILNSTPTVCNSMFTSRNCSTFA